jgi:hypothetical protein
MIEGERKLLVSLPAIPVFPVGSSGIPCNRRNDSRNEQEQAEGDRKQRTENRGKRRREKSLTDFRK